MRVGTGVFSILLMVIKVAMRSLLNRFLSKSRSESICPFTTRSPSRILRSAGSLTVRVIFRRLGWFASMMEFLLRELVGVWDVTAIAPVPSRMKINI